MASEVSSNSPDLIVGSMVKFETKRGAESFKGIVYTVNPEDGSFGIDDVSRTEVRGIYRKVEGFYQFFLKDVKDLRVIVPGPKPPTTTNTTTTKDDQKTNPGDASSSNTTKDDKKTNPGDASSSTTKDDQKSNPGDASSSTSPSK